MSEARRLVRSQLATSATAVVVAEAVDGADAIRRAAAVQPDVIILDDDMPLLSGRHALRWLRVVSPRSRLILHPAAAVDSGGVSGGCAPDVIVDKEAPAECLISQVALGALRHR